MSVLQIFRNWFFDKVSYWHENNVAVELRLQAAFLAGYDCGHKHGFDNGLSEGIKAAKAEKEIGK